MGDWSEARLIGVLVAAVRAERVLQVGENTRIGLEIAAALPRGGRLIVLERDAAAASNAREKFAEAGVADKAAVMIGDARRYLHKLAGPFDLVVVDAQQVQDAALFDRLLRLLQVSGTLVSRNLTHADDYNKTFAADSRLATVFLPAGAGVAVSVKRQD